MVRLLLVTFGELSLVLLGVVGLCCAVKDGADFEVDDGESSDGFQLNQLLPQSFAGEQVVSRYIEDRSDATNPTASTCAPKNFHAVYHRNQTTFTGVNLAHNPAVAIYRFKDRRAALQCLLAQVDGGGLWPLHGFFGDVSSVAVHPNGELFLLHRGPNSWQANTFNDSNVYQEFGRGPIAADVLLGVDADTGKELHRWGRDRFYLPHGLNIDSEGNFWITDVALHQVFKVNPASLEPTVVLGEAGVPGSDKSHFCKPTDVAVTSSGDFFVSDGYCNSRIVKFSPTGKYLLEFGRAPDPAFPAASDSLNIPHSLALVPKYDLLCVANREEEKIQCFSAGLQPNVPAGQFMLQLAHPALSRVFAIDYSPTLNKLYAVNGVGFSLEDKPMSIFSVDLASNTMSAWNPAQDGVDLIAPHDLAISLDGKYIFVADMAPQPRIWKFENGDFQQANSE